MHLIDISVSRNAYGRQIDSFVTHVNVPLSEEIGTFRAIFIRAPKIQRVGSDVEILTELQGQPIAVRNKNIFALTFHPELTDDPTRSRGIDKSPGKLCRPAPGGLTNPPESRVHSDPLPEDWQIPRKAVPTRSRGIDKSPGKPGSFRPAPGGLTNPRKAGPTAPGGLANPPESRVHPAPLPLRSARYGWDDTFKKITQNGDTLADDADIISTHGIRMNGHGMTENPMY